MTRAWHPENGEAKIILKRERGEDRLVYGLGRAERWRHGSRL